MRRSFRKPLPGDTGAEVPLSGEFTSTTPRVILDYKPNDRTTIYASYAEGNSPGGFNLEIIGMNPVAAEAFQRTFGVGYTVPESELKNYELGIKHTLGRRPRLR